VKTGNPGEVYMQYKLSNVFLTSVTIGPDTENTIETLVINFTKIEMVNYSSDESNVLIKSKTARFEFDKLTAPAGGAQSKSA
jgi:type VI protein secretion system component Hcp